MKTINTNELRDDMAEIISNVRYRGEKYTLTRHGKPVAMLVPLVEVVSDPTRSLLEAGAVNTAGPEPEPGKKSAEKSRKTPRKA